MRLRRTLCCLSSKMWMIRICSWILLKANEKSANNSRACELLTRVINPSIFSHFSLLSFFTFFSSGYPILFFPRSRVFSINRWLLYKETRNEKYLKVVRTTSSLCVCFFIWFFQQNMILKYLGTSIINLYAIESDRSQNMHPK